MTTAQYDNYYNAVQHWARERPDTHAFTFFQNGETPVATVTFAQLDTHARAVGAVLQTRGLTSAPVLLQYRPGLEFIVAFLGCLYAGAIAVPAYPPTKNRSKSDRLQTLIASCGAGTVLTDTLTLVDLGGEEFAAGSALPVICTDEISPDLAGQWVDPQADRVRTAFLQYSSGSTGDPKGVIVSHGNILHNQALIHQTMTSGDHHVYASWLPLFHDMGLIGNVMHPMYRGATCYLMPPTAFVQSPARWLRMISQYRVTCTGGPNFAYDMCVDRVTAEQREGLDLSCWRVAFNGAEVVRSATIKRFVETYRGCGLPGDAMYPCYGLAEGTLFVTGKRSACPPVEVPVDSATLAEGTVRVVAEQAEGVRTLVSSGIVHGDQHVAIVDPSTHAECQDGSVGEIWISGGSVSRGYWQRPDANVTSFARVVGREHDGVFFRTGDLGFFLNGELFVTGRLKEVLIVRGRNHYPHDIESTVQQAWSGFVTGGGAAFLCDEERGEQLVVVQEIMRGALAQYDHNAALERARKAVADNHGLTLTALVPIKPATLARTSSGKIRRRFIRSNHLSNGLVSLLAAS